MNYFKYAKVTKVNSKIWSLFTELHDLSYVYNDDDSNVLYGHTCELIDSALSGKISLTDQNLDNFCLKAYEIASIKQDVIWQKKIEPHIKGKELLIVDTDSRKEDDAMQVGLGDISSRKTLGLVDKNYDLVADKNAFCLYIEELNKKQRHYLIEEGVDIICVLVNSLNGEFDSIKLLNGLIEKDEYLGEIVKLLCSMNLNYTLQEVLTDIDGLGGDLDELFPPC